MSAKSHGRLWPMILSLTVTAAASGLILAAFFAWVEPIVAERRDREVIELGLRAIFPEAATFGAVDIEGLPSGIETPVLEVFDARGGLLGYFFNVSGQGWSPFKLAVGVDADQMAVAGVRVLEHQETPGLGSAIEEDWFLSQFQGKPLTDPYEAGQDVQMITGATVSTRGVAQTVAEAGRGLMAGLGFEVEPRQPAQTGGAAPAQPEFSAAVAALAGSEEVFLQPADVWRVEAGGEPGGMVVSLAERGYGGPVEVLVLIGPDGAVKGVKVLRHNETPGLGDAIEQPQFLAQFVGKGAADPVRVFEDIDGVTMATESSRAVAGAVRRALAIAAALNGKEGSAR